MIKKVLRDQGLRDSRELLGNKNPLNPGILAPFSLF